MLYSKEFYDIMSHFERTAKNWVRTGSQGFKREDKEQWKSQSYYCDDNANSAFKSFLSGYMLGKSEYEK